MADVEQEVMAWILGKLRYNVTTNPGGIKDPITGRTKAWITPDSARNVHGYPRISIEAVVDTASAPYLSTEGAGNTYVKKHVIIYQIAIFVMAGQKPVTYLGKRASDGKMKAMLSDEVERVLDSLLFGEEQIDDDDNIDVEWIDDINRRNLDNLDITESNKTENIPPQFIKVIDFTVIAYDRRAI